MKQTDDTIRTGKHAGRVVPTMGFELGATVTPWVAGYAHRGFLVITAR